MVYQVPSCRLQDSQSKESQNNPNLDIEKFTGKEAPQGLCRESHGPSWQKIFQWETDNL